MIVQGTPEWFALRCGITTSSQAKNILMDKNRAGYRNYQAQLVAERLTGVVAETFQSYDMERGIELEPVARSCFEFKTGEKVVEEGFLLHENGFTGSSPDGLIGSDGQVEIKVPKVATHISYLLADRVPPEYVPQMTHQLYVSGRQWNVFISYCPELGEDLQLFIKYLDRNEEKMEEMDKAVIEFNDGVEDMLTRLKGIGK